MATTCVGVTVCDRINRSNGRLNSYSLTAMTVTVDQNISATCCDVHEFKLVLFAFTV